MTTRPGVSEDWRRGYSTRIGNILLYGTFALIMFGPLAFGAVEPWSIFVIEAGTTFLALLWLARQWIDGTMRIRWNPLFPPMAAFALLILAQIAFRTSAYPHDTVSGALLYCAYGVLCFLSAQTLLRSAQARRLAMILCIYGAAIAAFALLQGVSPNGKIYWMRQPRLGGWVYGPYVNHNHYAGLMELLVPIPLILCLSRLTHTKERWAAAVAAAVMGGTIFLSGSRGGMLAFAAQIVMLAIILMKQRRGWRTAALIGGFLVILVGLMAWVGGAELAHRMASVQNVHTDINEQMRIQINRDGLRMFARRPVLGWGLGSFPIVYPQFRTFYTNFFVNQAHDDFLQLAVEMGLLGFATMIWFLVVVYRTAFRKIGNWTSDLSSAASLACVLAVTGILVHSFVDFNLQIPANAALFYVLCTLAAAQPFTQPSRKRRPVSTPVEDVPSPAPASEAI